MKKLLIAVAIAAASVTPQAFAQAKNFEGFSVLGAVNINNNKVESINSVSTTESNAALQAEYGLPLGESFVLGLGASFALNDINIAANAKLKNIYSFYVAPGIAVSKDVLVYGNIASISAKIDTTTAVGSADLSGIGYGFGARYFATKGLFFQGEYVFNKYNEKDLTTTAKVKNETGVLSIGVGYKF